MAKVRIQARSVDVDDASADGDKQSGDKQSRPKGRQAGAVDILARVWQREGVIGWYQVCRVVCSTAMVLTCRAGYASPDHKGGVVSGAAVSVEGAV